MDKISKKNFAICRAAIFGLVAVISMPADAELSSAAYEAKSKQAAIDWERLTSTLSPSKGFYPDHPDILKGKLIYLETDNLIGYRFSPGDFPFATTVGDIPVAGTFAPEVAEAVESIQEELGRDLGDDDNDGRWKVYAVVEGRVGQLVKRDQYSSRDIRIEGHHEVSAQIIRIVAAHCGPLTVVSKDIP